MAREKTRAREVHEKTTAKNPADPAKILPE